MSLLLLFKQRWQAAVEAVLSLDGLRLRVTRAERSAVGQGATFERRELLGVIELMQSRTSRILTNHVRLLDSFTCEVEAAGGVRNE